MKITRSCVIFYDVNFIDELSIMDKKIVVVGSSISKKILKKISLKMNFISIQVIAKKIVLTGIIIQ